MNDPTAPGTVTLARLFAAQGHWGRAADIYRRLLEREPGRQDIRRALQEAEDRLAAERREPRRRLEALFGEWIDLLLRYDRLKKLRRLARRI